ncbi:MAG TPA: response regulator [Myxococcales bacterium]|nr:response regulator [Myxococcales bacterium]
MARKKILVVDDSGTARMIEQMALGRASYDVVQAKDGAEAVQVAAREKPDLILMDVMMPNMDGYAACRGIRAQPVTRDIPVIMVTTRGEPVNVETGYASGCNDYVTKPVNTPELLAKVRSLIGE